MVVREKLIRLGQPGHGLTLGVELVQTGRLIGYVWLQFTDTDNRQAEVGQSIGEACRQEGYALEVMRGLLQFCFRGLHLHRVVCRTLVRSENDEHQATVDLLEQAGMRCEGEFIKNHFVEGAWANVLWHAMLGEEFKD